MDQFNFVDLEAAQQSLSAASTPAEAIQVINALTAGGADVAVPRLIAALSHYHPAVIATAVEGLIQLAPSSVNPLIAQFHASADHGLQGYIVQVLARIGDSRALALLTEVVGVSIANHCQGNIRRVAARGLGHIGSISDDPDVIHRCVEKLIWVLRNPEDWALRYAALVSLQEIGTQDAIAALKQAVVEERDPVVQLRIQRAIAPI